MTAITAIATLLKSAAWPTVALILGVLYKHEVKSIFLPSLLKSILRWKTLELWGIKIEAASTAVQQEQVNVEDANSNLEVPTLKELPGVTRTRALSALETELQGLAREIPEANRTDVLVHNLAVARMISHFSVIYSVMFGSQIAGLTILSARRRVSSKEAFEFYSAYEEREANFFANYGFTGWIGFLRDRLLVRQDGEDLVITDVGDDFLRWIKLNRMPENKLH